MCGYHFNGNKRLSDPNFWTNGPPEQGFFRIWQQAPAKQDGGAGVTDLEGVPSYMSTGTWLHFTVNKRSNNLQDFFVGDMSLSPANTSILLNQLPGDPPLDSKYQDPSVAGQVYRSQWAEVAWFLKPNGATAGTTNLYTLYRRQVLGVQDNYAVNWNQTNGSVAAPPPVQYVAQPPSNGYDDISYKTYVDGMGNAWFYFNSPTDLTQPARRFGMVAYTTSPGTPPTYSAIQLPSSLLGSDAAYAGLPQQSDGTYPIFPMDTSPRT